MINIMMLIITIVCLVYGIYVLITGKLLGKDVEGVAERNKRRFSRICGVVMLAESSVVGTGFYMEVIGRPYSRVLGIVLVGALACVVYISKKKLSK